MASCYHPRDESNGFERCSILKAEKGFSGKAYMFILIHVLHQGLQNVGKILEKLFL